MEERRRSKRTEMSSTLMVKRLDQGDMQEVSIDIVDCLLYTSPSPRDRG